MRADPRRTIGRREFLGIGAVAPTLLASLDSSGPREVTDPLASRIPTRKLGGAGLEISILSQEASRTPSALDRLIRYAYANGISTFDTADCYASSEDTIANWMRGEPTARGNIFLMTKDHPRDPSQMMTLLDHRLAALQTDRIDLFLIHSLGNSHSLQEAVSLVKSKELKVAVESIKRSGKARFLGFSTHHEERARIIEAAAAGGIVDAIMLQYPPHYDMDAPLSRALDAAHRRGIGLIAMKPMAGRDPGRILAEVSRRSPWLKERGLSPFQGLLHAIWSDDRICSCSLSMRNTGEIRENVAAAQLFAQIE